MRIKDLFFLGAVCLTSTFCFANEGGPEKYDFLNAESDSRAEAIVKLSLEYGINIVDQRSHTTLMHHAVFDVAFDEFARLVDNNPQDIEARDDMGRTPFLTLVSAWVAVEKLEDLAALDLVQKKFEKMIQAGVDYNSQDDVGVGSLALSVGGKTHSLLDRLLQEPDLIVDGKCAAVTTPLMLAVLFSDFAAVEKLLNAGADPYILTDHGSNLFHILAAKKNKKKAQDSEILALFFEKAIDLDPLLVDKYGMSPLASAAHNHNVPFLVGFLGQYDVNVNMIFQLMYNKKKDDVGLILSEGMTPLQFAILGILDDETEIGKKQCSKSCEAVIKLLLEAGADFFWEQENLGYDALEFAKKIHNGGEVDLTHVMNLLESYWHKQNKQVFEGDGVHVVYQRTANIQIHERPFVQ